MGVVNFVTTHLQAIEMCLAAVIVAAVDCALALNKSIPANGILHAVVLWAQKEQATTPPQS